MKTRFLNNNTRVLSEVVDGEGKRIAQDFLERLTNGFVKHSTKYMKFVYETPFAFGERQVNSILAPALAGFAEAFLLEIPANRKNLKQGYESHGWVDIWARYRKIDFYLEVKHSFASYKSLSINKDTHGKWEEAIVQIKDCSSSLMKMYDSNGIIILPLHIITIFDGVAEGEISLSIEDGNELSLIQKNHHHSLKNLNWSSLWTVPGSLAKNAYHIRENKDIYYPGVILASNISKLRV
ncbi:hypothetical protein [Litoribacter populi]|uniref:hypothetical protein n=1 Tax=Litoribacter populi TaxID=2598460 RepID=UPI00117DF65D|nr:hypothetical protein [Litoribacter populi]